MHDGSWELYTYFRDDVDDTLYADLKTGWKHVAIVRNR